MRRSAFLSGVGAAPIVLMQPSASFGQQRASSVTVFRTVPIDQSDGGRLFDVAFSYNFPGYDAIRISGYGDAPSNGALRFTTSSESVVFRAFNADATAASIVGSIDILALVARFDQILRDDHPANSFNSDAIRATAKYALGDDAGAVGELTALLWDNPYNTRFRLIRADAYINQTPPQFIRALADYEWIIAHADVAAAEELAAAHLGRARIANIYGQHTDAVSDYDAVIGHGSASTSRNEIASLFLLATITRNGGRLIPKRASTRTASSPSQLRVGSVRTGPNPRATAKIARQIANATQPKNVEHGVNKQKHGQAAPFKADLMERIVGKKPFQTELLQSIASTRILRATSQAPI